jgi:protein gp37
VTGIEWTDATWNPITGCSKVSPGCAHCYAETLALTRLAGKPGYRGLPWTPENAAANVVLHPDRLDLPLRWRKPRRVFVNSMSDLFHERVPAEFIDRVFATMALSPQHTFQVLTKRPERMAGYLVGDGITRRPWIAEAAQTNIDARWPLPNVWLGTSIENDRYVGRADALRETPAAVRFISAEPLLGPLPSLDLTGIDWLIVGGESGKGARPMDPEWVRDLRDRAVDAGVAFFFKQWGGRTPKAGGRLLDGRTWDEYPVSS